MTNALISYQFDSHAIRIVERDGEPWFVASDVCAALDIKNARDAISDLDEDEKGVAITDTLGGQQEMNIVSESGLFMLVFKSRKPEARRFRKWVTSEVLPSIRKTGTYSVDPQPAPPPPIAGGIDVPRLTAGVAAVREARRLYGPAAARRVWAELGLPIGIVPPGDDDEAFRTGIANYIGDAQEVTVDDIASALGIQHADRRAVRRIKDVLVELGFAEFKVKRRGRSWYAWQRREA